MNNDRIFAIIESKGTYAIQYLNLSGQSVNSIIVNENEVAPNDGFNYEKIFATLTSYKIGTGDYFNKNGEVLDFNGIVL